MAHQGKYGGKPSFGFHLGPDYGYLGHFANEGFLREGHNYVPPKAAKKAGAVGVKAAKGGINAAKDAGKFGVKVAKKSVDVAKKVFSFGLFGGSDKPKKEPRGTVARIKQRAEGVRTAGPGYEGREKKAFIKGTRRVQIARESGKAAVAYQKSQGVKGARHEARLSARAAGEGGIRKAGRVAARGQRSMNKPAVKEMRTAARADVKARQSERGAAMKTARKETRQINKARRTGGRKAAQAMRKSFK